MVQYKRKPIARDPPKSFRTDAEVWVMEATSEVFGTYESYLQRLDYYNQKKFTCEITGHTNLNFFEALKSETHGSAEVESTFPDQLREPILRKVQFSTVGRIDELVNSLYETFKEDFFPGEHVTVLVDDTSEVVEKLDGIVQDKASFPENRYADGTIERAAYSRYFVTILGKPLQEALVDQKHIFRDRRSFTKQVLRSFLKNTISRDRWDGAPWLVKESVAKTYNIETMIPMRLQYDHVVAERKALAALKKGRPDEQCLQYFATQGNIPGLSQAVKAHKGKLPRELVIHFQDALAGRIPASTPVPGLHLNGQAQSREHQAMSKRGMQPVLPPAVTVKYPIDDLEIYPSRHTTHRPVLKHLSVDPLAIADADRSEQAQLIQMGSVGPMLEIWNTLNVHAAFFVIDSFTFDDFVDAMSFSADDVECELLAEIHCAVLKTLVDDKGVIDPAVPVAPESDDEEEISAENSTESTPVPEVQPPPAKSTRNSLLRNDITESFRSAGAEGNSNGVVAHRAEDMLEDYDWTARVKDRDFKSGGWQTVVVGLLHLMSLVSRQTRQRDVCERILSHLAPVDQRATPETARQRYCSLDINSRVAALEIIIMLAITTRRLKDAMETRMAAMTEDRKIKVAWQRERKTLIEELHSLDDQRKLLIPDADPADLATNGAANVSLIKDELPDEIEDSDEDSDEEGPHRGRAARRISNRTSDLKRKRQEEEDRKEKQKQAKVEESGLKKVMRDIDKKKKDIKKCEDEVIGLEEKLRLNACHRSKVLGRDRYWNRYYWFERNGMPFDGYESSSTSHYGYANGRIWVQGPDDMERAGFIDLPQDEMAQYSLAFGMTVPKRKELEEGPTQLYNATEWGYYDDTESLDKLLAWLDDRGNRERALRKEIQVWRDRIVQGMENMKERLQDIAEKKATSEEPVVGIATRKKTYVDHSATRHPCLAWTNHAAKKALGHLHSEGAAGKKLQKGVARPKAVPVVMEKTTTRNGTRYR